MRLFYLQRHHDVSGVSGTGVVAQGCEFSDGRCALFWQSQMPSVCIGHSIDELIAVHGHGGNTTLHYQKPLLANDTHRPFWLGHTENRFGLSGVGIVAECCSFSNGFVSMRWLVPPYQIEVFTSYAHWEQVHANQPHTYVEERLTLEPVKGSILDTIFAEFRAYRKFTKGAWYLIRTPPVLDIPELWVRRPFNSDVHGIELFL